MQYAQYANNNANSLNIELGRLTRLHIGEKTCQCRQCNKVFLRKHDLMHTITHSGEKP